MGGKRGIAFPFRSFPADWPASMLTRTLEPEYTDDDQDTALYDAMDHAEVNRRFVDDLIAGGEVGPDILDIGAGTARIPIELCKRLPDVRVMATDAAISMLERAKVNIDVAGVLDRVQLEHADAKQMDEFADQMFDTVISNSILHHLPEPRVVLELSLRLVRPGGRIFHRDLLRPESAEQVEQLVQQHAAGEPESAQQLLRQSLHAALSLEEVREMAGRLGVDTAAITVTSDRHWTLDATVA